MRPGVPRRKSRAGKLFLKLRGGPTSSDPICPPRKRRDLWPSPQRGSSSREDASRGREMRSDARRFGPTELVLVDASGDGDHCVVDSTPIVSGEEDIEQIYLPRCAADVLDEDELDPGRRTGASPFSTWESLERSRRESGDPHPDLARTTRREMTGGNCLQQMKSEPPEERVEPERVREGGASR